MYDVQVFNQGGWPTNAQDANGNLNWLTVNNFNDLSNELAKGPIYAYYNNAPQAGNVAAHLIVVTGVLSAPGHESLVLTNNPWGVSNIQTYTEFIAGIPLDGYGMVFMGALGII